jgi:hypothetical protein
MLLLVSLVVMARSFRATKCRVGVGLKLRRLSKYLSGVRSPGPLPYDRLLSDFNINPFRTQRKSPKKVQRARRRIRGTGPVALLLTSRDS